MFGKQKKGRVSMLDFAEARELANQNKLRESLTVLLERAYNLTEEKINKMSKTEVNRLLANIDGITEGLICSKCGGKIDKLLCESCVKFDKSLGELKQQMLQEAAIESSGVNVRTN